MTKKNLVIVLAIIAAITAAIIYFQNQKVAVAPTLPQPATPPPAPQTQNPINVSSPTPNQTIASPLQISGEAPGPWFFEASFPIQLLDANNVVIATAVAQAQSDWMTTAFVPFTATLTFPPQPANSQGTLKFMKDNPSGLPQNDQDFQIPIQF